MKVELELKLSLTIEVDGRDPGMAFIRKSVIERLNEAMPTVIVDSDTEDCILFTDGWNYE